MKIAREVATRATCDRKLVGCILVQENSIVATGYNGSISKWNHCDDAGHIIINDSCRRTTHAEQNAICQAAKRGVSIKGATAYITCEPCWVCFKLLVTSGVERIVYSDLYRSEEKLLKEKKKEIVEQLSIKFEKI